jgi:hypothetical protein
VTQQIERVPASPTRSTPTPAVLSRRGSLAAERAGRRRPLPAMLAWVALGRRTRLRPAPDRSRRALDIPLLLSSTAPSSVGLGSFVGLLAPDGRLLEASWTPIAAGGSIDEVADRPFWERSWWCWSPVVRQRVLDAVLEAAAGHSVRYQEIARLPGCQLVEVDLSVVPLIKDGLVSCLIASVTDAARQPPADPR